MHSSMLPPLCALPTHAQLVHFAQSGKVALRGRRAAAAAGVNESMLLDGQQLGWFIKERLWEVSCCA